MSSSWSHCYVQPSPASTWSPIPARAIPVSPRSSRFNQHSHKPMNHQRNCCRTLHQMLGVGTRCPAELVGHLTWEMQQQLGKGEGPAGSRVGCSGHPARAGRSCLLQTPPAGPKDSETSRVMSTLSLLLRSPSRSPASIQLH